MFRRTLTRTTRKPATSLRENLRQSRRSVLLVAMGLEDRVLLSGSAHNPPGQVIAAVPSVVLPASLVKSAQHLTIGATEDPNLNAGGEDLYQIQPTADGRLIAEVQATSGSLELRLSLFDAQGNLLVQSDGQSIGQQNRLI